jgi:hypothetical protein
MSVVIEVNKIVEENASLLANLWPGIELDVRTHHASLVAKNLIETFYREIQCPTNFEFVEGEALRLGFSISESYDKTAYIFRRKLVRSLYQSEFEFYFGTVFRDVCESYAKCKTCQFRCDEHPKVGAIEEEIGSRRIKYIGRAWCTAGVKFEKVYEV